MSSYNTVQEPRGWVIAPADAVFSLPGKVLGTDLRIWYFDRGRGCRPSRGSGGTKPNGPWAQLLLNVR